MNDPVERLIQAIPADFFRRWAEYTHDAFGEADRFTREFIAEPEQVGTLGPVRHARCEAAVRKAATEVGLIASTPHTFPLGGRYSIIHDAEKSVHILRGNVQRHSGPPRPIKFRALYSSFNKWLNAFQPDLLEEQVMPPTDRLCLMLVTTSFAPMRGDQSIPAFIGLGIPRDDLSDWVRLLSISNLISAYSDMETKKAATKPIDPTMKDKAQPKLKRRPKGQGG